MIVRTAQLQAEGKLNDAHAALAKAFTTAKCRETVAWARELLGGNGISADYNVGRFRQSRNRVQRLSVTKTQRTNKNSNQNSPYEHNCYRTKS